jgi:beta-glucanase (GH16 family)
LALGASIGLLVGVTSTAANAASYGLHPVKAKSVHALLPNRLNEVESAFNSLDHHRWNPLPTWRAGVPTTTTTTTTTTDPPTTTTTDPPTTTTSPPQNAAYPYGIVDASEPSGMAPPAADALSGYSQDYVNDFSGSSLPSGWDVFTGKPGGDPGAQWGASHVAVSGGLLQLTASQDPAYGNEWVTGAVCQCGLSRTYGAYFVRSRVTGAGPTNVELLWPVSGWPPEIDFNETSGTTTATSATLHWSAQNDQDQRDLYNIDLTQWHTWGVIWTPTEVIYTVDGKVWGSVTKSNEISSVPMTLDLTQQTWCASGWACPSSSQSMQIDWVAEYAPQS